MPNEMLQAALAYGRMQWKVFPLHHIVSGECSCGKLNCQSPGKHPRAKGGFKTASNDETDITRYWTRWPMANIGIATGDGLVVLDVDGDAGRAELKTLIDVHGPLPETLTARTGRGFHIVFHELSGAPETRSSAQGNIHVRGVGGYIVGTPSLHISGRRYEWIKKVPLAPLPNWLRQWTQGYEISAKSAAPSLGELPAHLQKAGMFQRDIEHKLQMSLGMIWSASEQARLEQALSAIPSDRYETWVQVGMALQALRWETNESDIGFQIWDQWSARTPSKYAPAICEAKWQSFGRSRSGVTVGTIYHLARQHGWNPVAEVTRQSVNHGELNSGKQMNGRHVALPAELTARPILWPDVTEEGRPRVTMRNAMTAMTHMGVSCRYNRFNYRYMLGGHAIQQYGFDHLVDPAVVVLRDNAIETYRIDFQKEKIGDALESIGLRNHFDPIVDYLDRLQWDGVRRLNKWLCTYLAADDTALNEQFGRLTLIAAVRRARCAGTKFDQILVLEGREGTGKSQAVKILAGDEHFSDATLLNLTAQAQQENTEGVWIYELSELNGIKRAGAEALKQFASRPDDRARPAYGRYLQKRPRRCIFIGTTNRNDYLISDTGNRRFWPVKTGRVDLEGLKRDRDQLWAEAAEMERRGDSIILPERFWGSASEEQDKRMEADTWFDTIQEYLMNGESLQESASTRDVLCTRFQIPIGEIRRTEEMRVASILRRLGYTQRRKCRTTQGSKIGFEYRYFREGVLDRPE